MAGGVDAPKRLAGLDLHLHLYLLRRPGGEPLRGQGITVPEQAHLRGQELNILERDLPRLPRGDREDPGPERALADVLQERGVAGLPEVGEVDLGSLVGGENIPLHPFAVDPQDELLNHGSRGKGEDVGSFKGEPQLVAERLVHAGRGHAVLDRHRDAVVDDRQPAQGGPGMSGRGMEMMIPSAKPGTSQAETRSNAARPHSHLLMISTSRCGIYAPQTGLASPRDGLRLGFEPWGT